jgi:hypothetical protein
MITRSTTLAGDTIHYAPENSRFELTINSGGIFLGDGTSEISIEIGEDGVRGNYQFVTRVDELTDREVELIYHIALYQYDQFQREQEEYDEDYTPDYTI